MHTEIVRKTTTINSVVVIVTKIVIFSIYSRHASSLRKSMVRKNKLRENVGISMS